MQESSISILNYIRGEAARSQPHPRYVRLALSTRDASGRSTCGALPANARFADMPCTALAVGPIMVG